MKSGGPTAGKLERDTDVILVKGLLGILVRRDIRLSQEGFRSSPKRYYSTIRVIPSGWRDVGLQFDKSFFGS